MPTDSGVQGCACNGVPMLTVDELATRCRAASTRPKVVVVSFRDQARSVAKLRPQLSDHSVLYVPVRPSGLDQILMPLYGETRAIKALTLKPRDWVPK